jgi:uncharacterized protein (TIGR00288 family)
MNEKMPDKLNIAVFVDYDNIEIGVKSTLRREFDVSLALDALKERGDVVAKFAYANWGRQEGATRQMAENAVQMVQRLPSPRGDKNGADINLALDALEMAFTHNHVNAFAIISGDSDFIPLVNKLKEYGKTVYVVGGKAFTSTILQQNCHEFVSYESLLDDPARTGKLPPLLPPSVEGVAPRTQGDRLQGDRQQSDRQQGDRQQSQNLPRERRSRPAPLDLGQAMPLVERALQVLERREVQPQLGLLKSTMLQLDPTFSEKAYGAGSFSEFVDKLKRLELVMVSGSEGRYTIQRKSSVIASDRAAQKPELALPLLRDVLETHRFELETETSVALEDLSAWMTEEQPKFDYKDYGFQTFSEFLNFAQDKTVVRLEMKEENGMTVSLGAEFYPPAPPPAPPEPEYPEEEDEKQPIVIGQPSRVAPTPEPDPDTKPKRARAPRAPRRKTAPHESAAQRATRKPRSSAAPRSRKPPQGNA